jgi:hypothetical protein
MATATNKAREKEGFKFEKNSKKWIEYDGGEEGRRTSALFFAFLGACRRLPGGRGWGAASSEISYPRPPLFFRVSSLGPRILSEASHFYQPFAFHFYKFLFKKFAQN